MPTSSFVGLFIGICFGAISLLLRISPLNSKWLYTLYTTEQKTEANRYLSRLFLFVGGVFCLVALLPFFIDFRGLRIESFAVLALLAFSLAWRLTKKHISRLQP